MNPENMPDLSTIDGWTGLIGMLAAPFLTPWMFAAIIGAWALTNFGKLAIATTKPAVAGDETSWKATTAGVSLVAGAIAGAAVFGPLGDPVAVAVVALLNGALWRFAVAFAPKRVRRLLQTHIDRRFIPPEDE